MTFPLIRDQKSSTPLIEIYCGEALAIYATTSNSPVSHVDRNGVVQTFLPEPRIGVDLPRQAGGLEQEHCDVRIPRFDSQHPGIMTLAALLSEPRAVAPTTIRIRTIIKSSSDEETVVHLYEGVLDKDIRDPDGEQGLIKMSFLPDHLIYLEESSLGRRADATCDAIFGKTGCWVDTSQFFSSATGQSNLIRKAEVICTMASPASDRRVTLALDPAGATPFPNTVLTDHSEGWWVGGFLEKDGLRISIADWRWNQVAVTGTDVFILSRVPPASWDGASMTLHPGCQRTPAACGLRNNIQFFGGLGYGIPAYNPVLEDAR